EVRVSEGQTVIGGETIIANLNKENVQEKLTFDVI
ncbi:MAG: phosphatidylserine decarboxylase family protein, partial [Wolbachia endosymbiont of Andrena nigroaenea]|nr:phosphatidylserine decarboxylase family protein [Wolbachia endosymbiont of Nomada marshamella]MDX5527217.1 phosphatidylserine decarboxylase family protein [Wolbachia endosymbiont of Andrena nigroaenea]